MDFHLKSGRDGGGAPSDGFESGKRENRKRRQRALEPLGQEAANPVKSRGLSRRGGRRRRHEANAQPLRVRPPRAPQGGPRGTGELPQVQAARGTVDRALAGAVEGEAQAVEPGQGVALRDSLAGREDRRPTRSAHAQREVRAGRHALGHRPMNSPRTRHSQVSYMRRFFLTWRERLEIFQQPTEKLLTPEIVRQAAGAG